MSVAEFWEWAAYNEFEPIDPIGDILRAFGVDDLGQGAKVRDARGYVQGAPLKAAFEALIPRKK